MLQAGCTPTTCGCLLESPERPFNPVRIPRTHLLIHDVVDVISVLPHAELSPAQISVATQPFSQYYRHLVHIVPGSTNRVAEVGLGSHDINTLPHQGIAKH